MYFDKPIQWPLKRISQLYFARFTITICIAFHFVFSPLPPLCRLIIIKRAFYTIAFVSRSRYGYHTPQVTISESAIAKLLLAPSRACTYSKNVLVEVVSPATSDDVLNVHRPGCGQRVQLTRITFLRCYLSRSALIVIINFQL